MTPVALSLAVASAATALAMLPAVPLGTWLARTASPWRPVVEVAVLVPLVVPPLVVGWGLLALFGRNGPLGDLGLLFTPGAAVVAAAVVAFPLATRAVEAAVRQVDPRLEEAAATLGLSPDQVRRRVTWPLAAPGLAAGVGIAFGRALGEFGATVVVAGNLPGRTQTVPLALWTALQHPDGGDRAASWALVSIGLSVVALVAAWTVQRWGRTP